MTEKHLLLAVAAFAAGYLVARRMGVSSSTAVATGTGGNTGAASATPAAAAWWNYAGSWSV